jgi:hypothetical protein
MDLIKRYFVTTLTASQRANALFLPQSCPVGMRHFLQDDGEMYNMVSPFRWFTQSIFHAARDCYWTIQEHLTALVSGHPSRPGSVVKSDPFIDHLDPVHVVKTFVYSQFNMMIARASVGVERFRD